jgi:hypothetical protein
MGNRSENLCAFVSKFPIGFPMEKAWLCPAERSVEKSGMFSRFPSEETVEFFLGTLDKKHCMFYRIVSSIQENSLHSSSPIFPR